MEEIKNSENSRLRVPLRIVYAYRAEEREDEAATSGGCSVARLRRSCAHLNNAHNKVCNGEGGGWVGFR